MFFFLLLEAITIPAVNCTTSFMRESSVTRNALWERFKMVDNRKTVTFFSKFHLDRTSVIENNAVLVENPSGKILYLCILISQSEYIRTCHWETIFWFHYFKITV